MKQLILVAIATCFLSGCSYNVQPTTAPAVNVYSSYDSTIAGRWALVMDESVKEYRQEISPSSHACSAHNYPFEIGDSLSSSISSTLKNVFQEIQIRNTTPSNQEMQESNIAGVVVVRLDGMSPRLECNQRFWSVDCNATIDMSLGVQARGQTGQLFGTSVGSRKNYGGGAGGACGKAANKIAEAYKLALRDSLERMAEELSNSSRIRDYVAQY